MSDHTVACSHSDAQSRHEPTSRSVTLRRLSIVALVVVTAQGVGMHPGTATSDAAAPSVSEFDFTPKTVDVTDAAAEAGQGHRAADRRHRRRSAPTMHAGLGLHHARPSASADDPVLGDRPTASTAHRHHPDHRRTRHLDGHPLPPSTTPSATQTTASTTTPPSSPSPTPRHPPDTPAGGLGVRLHPQDRGRERRREAGHGHGAADRRHRREAPTMLLDSDATTRPRLRPDDPGLGDRPGRRLRAHRDHPDHRRTRHLDGHPLPASTTPSATTAAASRTTPPS